MTCLYLGPTFSPATTKPRVAHGSELEFFQGFYLAKINRSSSALQMFY
jgi:hypothetical protein